MKEREQKVYRMFCRRGVSLPRVSTAVFFTRVVSALGGCPEPDSCEAAGPDAAITAALPVMRCNQRLRKQRHDWHHPCAKEEIYVPRRKKSEEMRTLRRHSTTIGINPRAKKKEERKK